MCCLVTRRPFHRLGDADVCGRRHPPHAGRAHVELWDVVQQVSVHPACGNSMFWERLPEAIVICR